MGDADDFKSITFEKERQHALEDLARLRPACSAFLRGEIAFPCTIIKDEEDEIIVRSAVIPAPAMSENDLCELMFSLRDGQYLLISRLHVIDDKTFSLSMRGELRRLQRRNNFRVSIDGFRGTFTLFHEGSQQTVSLIDLSAGGARVRWPVKTAVHPIVDREMRGVLRFEQNEIEIPVSIRSTSSEGSQYSVRLEFGEMSGADERALLFLCLQVQRNKHTIL
ncbi:MAG TPA: PilZ domain-containing protein [Bdellovibrionales bacterium]|jgi:c-di-GMP-binding flagellar brake protein YcgR|nr:PilZ domain-containing protein [Bdellovibrionales bacterium]